MPKIFRKCCSRILVHNCWASQTLPPSSKQVQTCSNRCKTERWGLRGGSWVFAVVAEVRFRVWGLAFRMLGLWNKDLGCRIQGSGLEGSKA